MVELELLGLHGDGEHVTLTDQEGRRYRLAIDDALRAAVRRERPRLESMPIEGDATLRPKEIQAFFRAGASVEEVAERSGLPEDHVRRYFGPVVAERNWVVQQAQGQRVGREIDAPRLGDLVLDRLAARGVEVTTLDWTAVRRPGKPWEVVATFVAGDKEREARWSVDLAAKTLHAIDDEARWLSETELGTAPQPRRHLSSVVPGGDAAAARSAAPVASSRSAASAPTAGPAPDLHADAGAQTPPAGTAPSAASASTSASSAGTTEHEGDETESLLAELAANRGTRMDLQPELEPHDDDGENMWGAHPPASRPEEARDAHVLSLPRRERRTRQQAQPEESPPAAPAEDAPAVEAPKPRPQNGRRARRNNRRSVPSWDEIVFGARPE
ncbi:hypothetical protein GCM10023169_39960 [Georgenia halophila]|uniref:DUF3071 domain-containing protein n=1 Tax=Georgenia halophila TaxID=620889 RepID=A0ABP8LNN6_9MICO